MKLIKKKSWAIPLIELAIGIKKDQIGLSPW
jgi:hypothetical protein